MRLLRLPKQLVPATDWPDPDETPTRPGEFETPGGLPDPHIVNRLICPHHHVPWGKIAALALAIDLVARVIPWW